MSPRSYSHLQTSCLSCCSPLHPLPVNDGFPDGGLLQFPSSSQPPSPSQGAVCWPKGAEASQGALGRSGLTGKGGGCKPKSFGSLLEDTGQMKRNHHPQGVHQLILGLLAPEVPAGRAQISAAIAVTAIAVLPVPVSLLKKRLCPLPVPRVIPAFTRCFPLEISILFAHGGTEAHGGMGLAQDHAISCICLLFFRSAM